MCVQPDLLLGCAQPSPPAAPQCSSGSGAAVRTHNHPCPFHKHCRDADAVSGSPQTPQNPQHQHHPLFTLWFNHQVTWKPLCNSTWRLFPLLSSFVGFPPEMPNTLQTNPILISPRCAHFAFHGKMLAGREGITQTRTISVLLFESGAFNILACLWVFI